MSWHVHVSSSGDRTTTAVCGLLSLRHGSRGLKRLTAALVTYHVAFESMEGQEATATLQHRDAVGKGCRQLE